MIAGWIALISVALLASNVDSKLRPEWKPSWTLKLSDPYFRNQIVAELPEMNGSCGISQWDEKHALVYYITTNKYLVSRAPDGKQTGGWSFAVRIVRTDDGEVEKSASIPADSFMSELAVVAGGIVVSNRDHLTFYSREFTRIDPVFTYEPLDRPLLTIHGPMGDLEHLHVTDDQRSFLLVDSSGLRSRFFLFDGGTFKEQREWMLSGVDPQSVSIKGRQIIYGRLISGNKIADVSSWSDIDDANGTPTIRSGESGDMTCRIPITVDVGSFLGTCGSVEILKTQGSEILYHLQKQEVVSRLIRMSPDGRLAAILKYRNKGGGVLDLTERRTSTDLLIVNLSAPYHLCEMALLPMPHAQLSFIFARDSTLIVLNDGLVRAYKSLCSQ